MTVPNAYRRGGRRLDADTGNNLSFTGNVGTQTALVYVEYDYANKTVTSWMDEV